MTSRSSWTRLTRRWWRSPRGGASVLLASLLSVGLGVCATRGSQAKDAANASTPRADLASIETASGAWAVVVNNGVVVPTDPGQRTFNSYNQPSVNLDRLVVFRARSKGGGPGEPAHGVFTRDMKTLGPVTTVFDRNTLVPQPNNLGTTFTEPPSFPRIDMSSSTLASRGNHPPVWEYTLPDGADTRGGTTGIYTQLFGDLIAGESNLGPVPGFPFFAVPGIEEQIKFDVFPGAPAVTDVDTIVFKGNFTAGGASGTGVYYRDLSYAAAGGTNPAVVIADTSTTIPGSTSTFGSTAPPSAAGRRAVFAGFDEENAPTAGGIYLAPLAGARPPLTPLVTIGQRVPGERPSAVFNKLGEGLSFDGRFVAFWGAWGTEVKTLTLQCPTEGNKLVLAYCMELYPNGFTTTVPVHQGIFVHDTRTHRTFAVAKAPQDFSDFVYWNFSGKVPAQGDSEPGEPARWRTAAFVAVSGRLDGETNDAVFHAAFKARTGPVVDGAYVDPTDGIYLRAGPGASPIRFVVQTGMPGTALDPAAVIPETTTPLPVNEMGIERDGFRGNALVVAVTMGTEEAGSAGIYLKTVEPEQEEER